MADRIVGIDLGTSTSVVAALDQGAARILALDERERVIPTVVSIAQNGEIVVGAIARDQLETNPEYTFTGLKRLLGRKADDPQILEWAKLVAYDIVPGPQGEAFVRGPDKIHDPVDLLSHVFAKLRETARQTLGEDVNRCVVGVPAHFDLDQKEAIRRAAKLGGLEAVRLLPEPTAAAVAYGVDRASNRTIAIYDLGGGTFDITILKIAGQRFRPLATAGDPFLGGEDFDQRIMSWLLQRFREKHGIDLRDDPSARNRVRLAAEKAKESLSAQGAHRIYARNIAHRPLLLDLDETIDRADYENMVLDLIDRTRGPCREALRAAKVDVRDIDEVVLVGGMTRTPAVGELVREIFGRVPSRRIDPIAAVALGCALQGAALAGTLKSVALTDNTTMPFSVQVGSGALIPLIRANTPLPAREEKVFGIANREAAEAAVRVYHGQRRVATLIVNDMQEQVKSEPLLRVQLDVNDDGMLTVTARNPATKTEVTHSVHADTGMTASEIQGLRDIDEEEAAA
jgi:molecular chaperone DnaK